MIGWDGFVNKPFWYSQELPRVYHSYLNDQSVALLPLGIERTSVGHSANLPHHFADSTSTMNTIALNRALVDGRCVRLHHVPPETKAELVLSILVSLHLDM